MKPPLSSSSSSPKSPSSHHPPSSLFTPIQECEREEDEVSETKSQSRQSVSRVEQSPTSIRHHPTPLHEKEVKAKKKHEEDGSVSCNKCRPQSREKISVVPLDNNNSNGINKHSFPIASPNTIFKSIFSSLTRKSPKSADSKEEQWKIAVAELSHKLIQATRKRDEAVLEASRLKSSMAETEKKLNKLEIYCQNLKPGLDECTGNSPHQLRRVYQQSAIGDKGIEQFLVSVSDSRSSVRLLSRSLTLQVRHVGNKVYERISALLQPHGIKITISKNPKSFLFYLEALLNKCFFEDFESIGYQKSSTNQILNPVDRCESNYNSFNVLEKLTWEEVLSNGTRHFSEEFSRFCDRKMNEIVAMLEWNKAWPESLLQAFFAASKSVWLVHLLANSVHPGLPIFRVDKGVSFDSGYMEDMGGDRAQELVPTTVRIMVAPGFYVYGNVVKCKVLCRYHNNVNDNNFSNGNGQGLTP